MRVLKIPVEIAWKGFCLFRVEETVDGSLSLLAIAIRVGDLRLALPPVLQRTSFPVPEYTKHIVVRRSYKYYMYVRYNTSK